MLSMPVFMSRYIVCLACELLFGVSSDCLFFAIVLIHEKLFENKKGKQTTVRINVAVFQLPHPK